jgi:hypothetical protein
MSDKKDTKNIGRSTVSPKPKKIGTMPLPDKTPAGWPTEPKQNC